MPLWLTPARRAALLAVRLADPAARRGLRDRWDRLAGHLRPDGHVDEFSAALFFHAVFYHEAGSGDTGTPASPPLLASDKLHGLWIAHNRVSDHADAVLGASARGHHPGGHSQHDAGSIRFSAAGWDWILGGGQAWPEAAWQSRLVAYRKSNAPVHYHGTIAWIPTDQHTDGPLHKGLNENLASALRAAKPVGYLIEEFPIGAQPVERVLRQLAARGIGGIIFLQQRVPGTRLEIDLSGFAAVRVGETLESPKLNSVHPNQYGNALMFCENLRTVGWSRIGFYLPKVIDWRTAGTFSAAYWRWQQNLPVHEHCETGLPETFDDAHFAEWFRRNRPQIIHRPCRGGIELRGFHRWFSPPANFRHASGMRQKT